ncbi:MAG: DNA polymerase III subunit gamma/tau C-terminal domain-containing protein [Sodalis sp. (in: enterobacteria)]
MTSCARVDALPLVSRSSVTPGVESIAAPDRTSDLHKGLARLTVVNSLPSPCWAAGCLKTSERGVEDPHVSGHISLETVSEQTGLVSGPVAYLDIRAGDSPSSNIPTQNPDASYIAGRAAKGGKAGASISGREPSLTERQMSSVLGGRARSTRQAIALNSADKGFMQAHTASRFRNNETEAKWQPGTVMPDNIESPATLSCTDSPLLDATAQLLLARTELLQRQESQKIKKAKPAPARQQATLGALECLATGDERASQPLSVAGRENQAKTPPPEAYRWRASQQSKTEPEPLIAPKALRTALGHKKTPELTLSLAEEALERDPWAAQVHRLALPKLVRQLALNAWKKDLAPGKVCLYLRASQRHLNSATAKIALRDALSADLDAPVELTVIEDDNLAMKTPLEWHQTIYEEKLMHARKAIMTDAHIKMLQRFFDAKLDEDSIRPV